MQRSNLYIGMFGPPGVGKGTQTEFLVKHYNFYEISTGKIIRNGIRDNNPDALQLKKDTDEGKLAPDTYILNLVRKAMIDQNTGQPHQKIIFDGVPRTTTQATTMDTFAPLDVIIALEAPEDEIIKRLSTRKECPQCRTAYGLTRIAPDICECGGTPIRRPDDEPDKIITRLNTYEKQTKPVLEYYNERVIKIQSTGNPEDVFKTIIKTFDKMLVAETTRT